MSVMAVDMAQAAMDRQAVWSAADQLVMNWLGIKVPGGPAGCWMDRLAFFKARTQLVVPVTLIILL